jgi:stage V sporulation protein B
VSSSEDARRAGRGLVSIAGAKGYFIVTSYAVQLLLPRIFGEAKEFGLYSATMSGVAILTNVLIVATIQSVSKFVSEDEVRAAVTLGALALGLFLFAPVIARLLLDDQLTRLIRVASVVVFAYALYAAIVGSLNGKHLFAQQARLDATFSTLRTGSDHPVDQLDLDRPWKARRADPPPSLDRIHGTDLDLPDLPQRHPHDRHPGPQADRDRDCVCQRSDRPSRRRHREPVRRLLPGRPYQLIISMTFIVFPMISKATSIGNREAARSTIQHAMRLSLLLLLLVAAPTSGAAHGVMRLAYPVEYLAGAPALSILVFGVAAFALFAVAATAISGAGKPSVAAMIAGVSLLAVVVANRALVLRAGLGEQMLEAAATGTAIGMVIALVLSAWVIRRLFGVFIPPATWLRAAVAAGAGYGVASAFPSDSRMMALVALGLGFASSVAVLVVTRELTRDDWHALRRIVRRD